MNMNERLIDAIEQVLRSRTFPIPDIRDLAEDIARAARRYLVSVSVDQGTATEAELTRQAIDAALTRLSRRIDALDDRLAAQGKAFGSAQAGMSRRIDRWADDIHRVGRILNHHHLGGEDVQ